MQLQLKENASQENLTTMDVIIAFAQDRTIAKLLLLAPTGCATITFLYPHPMIFTSDLKNIVLKILHCDYKMIINKNLHLLQ